MKRLTAAALIAVSCILGSGATLASEVGVSVTFSDAEARIISAWYSDHKPKSDRKHGKPGRDGLPPGIARNLARGKALPPGIAMQYLPEELRRSLPALPNGYERIIVDGKVLLVEVATRVIHDVLMDVVLD